MRVTRLEIFGFKSFVERFTLNFERNMIGIVGPNGCGKSNIVDALRWVLGETYAKQLRGAVLDDLIFNGSETRRPLGMAEVSVTIRPDAGWADAVRSGKAAGIDREEALIIGGEGASSDASDEAIVTTGEIGDAPTRPTLTLIKGAKGSINGTTDAAADGEEESLVPPLLREVPGLLGASEIQFTRRLYRSGESEYFINKIPCRLRDMTDIYRLIGLGARGLSIVQQGEIGALISKKPIERRELLEEAAGISGFRTRMEAAQRKLDQTSENVARLKDIVIEVEKQVRVLQRQAKRARERNELKANLKDRELSLFSAKLVRLAAQREQHALLVQRLEAELESARAELSIAESRAEELRATLEGHDVELSDVRSELDKQQVLLNAAREQQRQLEIDFARIEARSRGVAAAVTRLEERQSDVRREREQRESALGGLRERLALADANREGAEAKLREVQERRSDDEQAGTAAADAVGDAESALRREIEQLSAEVERSGEVIRQLSALEQSLRDEKRGFDGERDAVQKHRVRVASVESEVRSLESQLDALTEQVVKRTGSLNDSEYSQLADQGVVRKVLLAGIRAPEELQRPLAAVLGERSNYLVSSDPGALGGRYLVEQAKIRDKDKAIKIGVIDEQSGLHDANDEALAAAELAVAPSAVRLISLITTEPHFQGAVTALIGSFWLVDSLGEALALNASNRAEGRPLRYLATRSGEIATPWGWYTTEGKGASFSFTRRIEEQKQRITEMATEGLQLEATVAARETRVAELQQEIIAAQSERDRLFAVQKRVGVLVQQERQLERERREAIARAERERRDARLAEERAAQNELRRLVSERAAAESALSFEVRKIEDLARDLQALAGQQAAQQQELFTLEQEQQQLATRLSERAEGHKTTVANMQAVCEELGSAIAEIDNRRSVIRGEVHQASQLVSQARREADRLQEQSMKAGMQLERSDMERSMLLEELTKSYPEEGEQFELNEALTASVHAAAENDLESWISELQEESGKLRRRLEREGEVDPQAIELFEQEDARLTSMQTQLADLEAAQEILERTIRQLKDISRSRFLATFNDVNQKFSSLIPRLFGGGAGHLELINPEDPLTSGVQLVVRPPGKRVSNMELLSGGEKALVAVAVLVAMFLHRPSPICVLDEVDAPLDEANLERYLNLIKEISQGTQFLVITHNKQTMAAADRLVGITMQERGVTTALTVTLEEAENVIEQAAANA